MHSKRWLHLVVAMVLAFGTQAALADHGQGKGKGHGNAYGHEKHGDRDDDDRGHGYYRGHDRELREWYRVHYSSLPPGLAKRDELPPGLERQLAVRGTLPPGLRKKLYPCPVEVVRYLPPPPPGYAHMAIGGHIVLVNRSTFFVLDVFHFEM